MTKEKIIHERKLAICREIFELIKQHPEFDIAVTINFDKPATLEKTWLISQKKIIGESVSVLGSE